MYDDGDGGGGGHYHQSGDVRGTAILLGQAIELESQVVTVDTAQASCCV